MVWELGQLKYKKINKNQKSGRKKDFIGNYSVSQIREEDSGETGGNEKIY